METHFSGRFFGGSKSESLEDGAVFEHEPNPISGGLWRSRGGGRKRHIVANDSTRVRPFQSIR
jgi:hypothetical protein